MLGRYCNHLHMAGDQAHSYIRSNSVHHSFQRAVTIHGSHNALIENNVAYDVVVRLLLNYHGLVGTCVPC